jgi:hypothetical protein
MADGEVRRWAGRCEEGKMNDLVATLTLLAAIGGALVLLMRTGNDLIRELIRMLAWWRRWRRPTA